LIKSVDFSQQLGVSGSTKVFVPMINTTRSNYDG
jgi:hypothetical protein